MYLFFLNKEEINEAYRLSASKTGKNKYNLQFCFQFILFLFYAGYSEEGHVY